MALPNAADVSANAGATGGQVAAAANGISRGPTGATGGADATGASGATGSQAPLSAPPTTDKTSLQYKQWVAQAQKNGYSVSDINNATLHATAQGVQTASAPAPTPAPTPSATSLGNWQPGQVYAGSSTPGSTSDQSFIPTDSGEGPGATSWDVTPDQTVQGQLTKLTTNLQDNPLYQQIAEQMKRANAANGGTNSLMAETAAYGKVVDLAFNIASEDAATYAKSAEFNASMKNQFGLAAQQFRNTAMLSDQNYKQSQVLQAEQINGNLQSVSMQIAGQLQATQISADAQTASAGIYANASTTAAQISATTSIQNAQLASDTSLKEANISRQTTLDSIGMNFDNTWALNEQQFGHQVDFLGDQTSASDWENAQQTARQTSQQLTLQHGAEYNNLLNLTTQGNYQIATTPGLSPQQQSGAIATGASWFQTNTGLLNSFYSSGSTGMANGSWVNSSGGNFPGMPYGSNPQGGSAQNDNDPYNDYGNYLAFPGYEMTAPPKMPYEGGTGATMVGGNQPQPVFDTGIGHPNSAPAPH